MKRTVIQILDFIPRGSRSMEVFLVSLAQELSVAGWRTVHVVAGEPGDFFQQHLKKGDLPIVVARLPLRLRDVLPLYKKLRAFRPDVLQITFISKFSLSIWLLKWLLRGPRLIVVDQSSGLASNQNSIKRFAMRIRGAIAGLMTYRFVTVSDFVRKRDIETVFLPAHKMKLVYNGVDLRKYESVQRVDFDRLTIAFVGQLIPEKGVATLLKAVKHLTSLDVPSFKVMIAGEGRDGQNLRQYCEQNSLGQVEFLGQIDWAARLYASADIVVVPSEWAEAFGFVAAEAMGCGACIVASDSGALPEVVGSDGVAGVLFRRGDVNDLAEKMYALIKDPGRRSELKKNAQQRSRRFSLDQMVKGYKEVFGEIPPIEPMISQKTASICES